MNGLVEKAELGALKWFSHVQRIDQECLVKNIVRSDVIGLKAMGRH